MKMHECPRCGMDFDCESDRIYFEWAWKWQKWTFGFWRDKENHTAFGIDFGPLELCWRYPGYCP